MAESVDELVLALRRGEEQALAVLYDRYGGAVYNLALRITQDAGMAQEVCLDAFLQLWRQAHRFDSGQGTLSTWLLTIVRRRAIDRLRAATAAKRAHTDEVAPPDAVRQPHEVAEFAERRRLVREAMAALPASQRAALELAYYEGLSHSQIAERTGEPLGTIKTRIRQAMTALRSALAPVLSVP